MAIKFGQQAAAQIAAWGLVMHNAIDGKVRVESVDGKGVAAQSGVKKGAWIKSINRIAVHDLSHLEGLLLQSGGKTVEVDLEPSGRIILPLP